MLANFNVLAMLVVHPFPRLTWGRSTVWRPLPSCPSERCLHKTVVFYRGKLGGDLLGVGGAGHSTHLPSPPRSIPSGIKLLEHPFAQAQGRA